MTDVLAGVGAGVAIVTLTATVALSIRVAKLEQRVDWLEHKHGRRVQ